ncbi:hypothetical protein MSG28_003098 [Choristoneura fumiferana]|uniref:Uncharacterized protein n=1 Tax=Choristoneura fumiferana TaxID=7141 RepID=A0ACC0KE87_CHOFU|nr:hypothetical protein MSG28_003098 [Choristoneura fumiferana]
MRTAKEWSLMVLPSSVFPVKYNLGLFKARVNRLLASSALNIRSDNGTGYVNTELMNFLKRKGIVHQLTVPYSPQQNGSAERFNRSLLDKVRCLLFNANLDDKCGQKLLILQHFLLTGRQVRDCRVKYPKRFGVVIRGGCKTTPVEAEPERVSIESLDYPLEAEREPTSIESPNYPVEAECEHEYVPSEDHLEEPQDVQESSSHRYNLRPRIPKPTCNVTNVTNVKEPVEPRTVKEALSCEDKELWQKAMQEEIDSFILHAAWELTDKPVDKNVVKTNVQTAFLNGELREEIYMQQPEGFHHQILIWCQWDHLGMYSDVPSGIMMCRLYLLLFVLFLGIAFEIVNGLPDPQIFIADGCNLPPVTGQGPSYRWSGPQSEEPPDDACRVQKYRLQYLALDPAI